MKPENRTATLVSVAAVSTALMLLAGSLPAGAQSPAGSGPAPAAGDASTVTLVTTLGDGEITCARPAPSIRWSLAGFNRFKVFVGADPDFESQITSGSMLLSRSAWTIPATKWASLCSRAPTHLYIKVSGTVAGTERAALGDADGDRMK